MRKIHRLYPQATSPIGHFVRIGHTGHRELESLYVVIELTQCTVC